MNWTVHKFGGSSLKDAECIARVTDICESLQGDRAIVVSAMGGFTDGLLSLVTAASQNRTDTDALDAMRARYSGAAESLLDDKAKKDLLDQFEADLEDIGSVLQALTLVGSASHRSRDLVAGFGELWSARLLAAVLEARGGSGSAVSCLDARDVLVVEPGDMGPSVDWGKSRTQMRNVLQDGFHGTLVITGFIARDGSGLQTTLGRNGSDYSASIFGALLEATEVNIWTDVDGVMSGDPRLVPEATVIDSLSYSEAMELAYFGAKVLHPQTMAPAIGRQIPIRIRNTFNPKAPGTTISATSGEDDLIKGITAINDVALLNLEGSGMIGVPGTADRLFGALRQAGVSVILISQGSSEHSICFAVPQSDADSARSVVQAAFAAELSGGHVQSVDVSSDCSIIAVVGDGMAGLPGIAGRFFNTLGKSAINVKAIAQGASERNISAVIAQADTTRALRAVHSSFYLSAKTLSIGLIGPGAVGAALLDQLSSEEARLRSNFSLDLRVRGLASSKRMLLAERRLSLEGWREAFASAEALDMEQFVDHTQADHMPHAVIVDCSASDEVASQYGDWLRRGIHVVTPNKKANSSSISYYRTLQELTHAGDVQFLYETTVGAGLPVIQTLRDLVNTGDDIHHISGIFSGTLAYLFNVFDGERPFSTIVREAKEKGYTEPDPRDDLSGMDVGRKLVILAREAGLDIEIDEVDIESLVPAKLAGCDPEEFLDRLADFDGAMTNRLNEARAKGQVLRYVGHLDVANRQAAVSLQSFEDGHPFANIALTDNIVQFATGRYRDNPLIIRGPGAGPDVTAAGVFADILRLSATLTSGG